MCAVLIDSVSLPVVWCCTSYMSTLGTYVQIQVCALATYRVCDCGSTVRTYSGTYVRTYILITCTVSHLTPYQVRCNYYI